MSSCYQNACLAAREVPGVYLVVRATLSTGMAWYQKTISAPRREAAIQKAMGGTHPRVEASFVIDRLDYLYKGGRCSALAALGANLLHLKPCIEGETAKWAWAASTAAPMKRCCASMPTTASMAARTSTASAPSSPGPPAPSPRWTPCAPSAARGPLRRTSGNAGRLHHLQPLRPQHAGRALRPQGVTNRQRRLHIGGGAFPCPIRGQAAVLRITAACRKGEDHEETSNAIIVPEKCLFSTEMPVNS